MMYDKPAMPVSGIEMQEYLFAQTTTQLACNMIDQDKWDAHRLSQYLRESFRFQRFAVMNWLMLNNVSIPAELLSDQTHPIVGNQFPDRSLK